MATTSETIYTHTCDLCGAQHGKDKLRRVGLTSIPENTLLRPEPRIYGQTCDVCPDCTSRPVADVLAHLQPPEDEELRALRMKMNGSR